MLAAKDRACATVHPHLRNLHALDPEAHHTISAHTQHSDCDFTLFEGKHVHGKVKQVFLRGQLIVDGESWLGQSGQGRFVARGEIGAHW